MKAILISIHPQYCELIASGEKTIEIRKTKPKIQSPFKCYIYQTQHPWLHKIFPPLSISFGKVIGEFVCDEILVDKRGENADIFCSKGKVSLQQLIQYGKSKKENEPSKTLYGWHISQLVIYEEAKPLVLFHANCSCKPIQVPPQSWFYVEDMSE